MAYEKNVERDEFDLLNALNPMQIDAKEEIQSVPLKLNVVD